MGVRPRARRVSNPSNSASKVQGLGPRRAALDLLTRVLDDHEPLDRLIEAGGAPVSLARLSVADRGLARAIATTTLRHLGEIDRILKAFIAKPLPAKAGRARHVLRLAVAQILFLEVADHAAVQTAVELVSRDRRTAPWAALTNAVLRRVGREGRDHLETLDRGRYALPLWLWRRWSAVHGEPTARAIGLEHVREPALDVTVKSDAEAWARRLDGTVLATGSVRVGMRRDVRELPGYSEGAWWVQDAAASLPARLFGDIAGKRIADLCAAPGGKTAQLVHRGAIVTAVDKSESRLGRLRENLARLNLEAETIAADLLEWQPDTPFDAILLDAPCSATGTIRRHPDVAWIKSEKDVVTLAALQARLLDSALDWVVPGGSLVYCTCSLEPEEGERQIEAVLERRSNLRRAPISPEEVGGLRDGITQDGDLRTLPCHRATPGSADDDTKGQGMDGFFAARLVRV